MSQRISKILICDDHAISQVGIQCTLSDAFPDRSFEFSKTLSGAEALRLTREAQPDLLILDLHLPDLPGFEVLKSLRSEGLKTKILVITGEERVHTLLRLLRYGVEAILLKSESLARLQEAVCHIEQNGNGEAYLDPLLKNELDSESAKLLLSPREYEVLELLLKGYTNKVIAEMLGCSAETVKAHLTKIREKTQLSNRDEISAWFHRRLERSS